MSAEYNTRKPHWRVVRTDSSKKEVHTLCEHRHTRRSAAGQCAATWLRTRINGVSLNAKHSGDTMPRALGVVLKYFDPTGTGEPNGRAQQRHP